MVTSLCLVLLLAAAPEVALLSTGAESDLTELRFQGVGDARVAPVVARLTHLAGESVQGALVPGSHRVLAVAVTEARRDLSFASSLFLLEPGKPARFLADRIALATRPLVTRERRVFVQRGVSSGTGVDALTIDEIDLTSGRAREVLAFTGSTAFLAGSVGRELIVYRVSAEGADLIAIHEDSLGVRTLLSKLAPLARDFVVTADGKALLFTQFDRGADRWFIARLDLGSLAQSRIAEGPTMALLPTALPDGRVAFAPGPGRGLVDFKGATVLDSRGPGFERIFSFTADGVPVGLHETPGAFPVPLGFAAPPLQRLEIAGVAP